MRLTKKTKEEEPETQKATNQTQVVSWNELCYYELVKVNQGLDQLNQTMDKIESQ